MKEYELTVLIHPDLEVDIETPLKKVLIYSLHRPICKASINFLVNSLSTTWLVANINSTRLHVAR